jgi:hypothetical protein
MAGKLAEMDEVIMIILILRAIKITVRMLVDVTSYWYYVFFCFFLAVVNPIPSYA